MTCPSDEHDVMCDGNGECFRLADKCEGLLAALRDIAELSGPGWSNTPRVNAIAKFAIDQAREE